MEKKSEFAERSVLVTVLSVKMNQRAEIVAISRTLAIHTERKTAREKGKYAGHRAGDLHRRRHRPTRRRLRGRRRSRAASTRWWEDVTVGDVLTPMAKGPLTDDRHDRLPCRRLRLRPLRAVCQSARL